MRGCSQVTVWMALCLAACGWGWGIVAGSVAAEETVPAENQRAEYLAQMKSLVEATKVVFKKDQRKPKLVATPVFRYDDQPRRFIDATMWVWTDGGRPVAFQKIEAMIHRNTNMPLWGYCFTSVSTSLLETNWAGGHRFETKEPGIVFQSIPGAPAVAERDVSKKRQVRELARGFAARALLDPRRNDTQELRLLPTPILEYSDPSSGRFLGSVFAFSANGTNPDLLVLFEPLKMDQKSEWQFAPARMTSGGVTVTFRDKTVWETPHVDGHDAAFATWTFFQTPRIPLTGE